MNSRTFVLLGAILSAAACSAPTTSPNAASAAPSAGPSTAASISVAPASVAPASVAPTSARPTLAGAYSTRAFLMPLDVVVPDYVEATPAEDSANFVTWLSADESLAIRFLHPVVVYPPGSTTTAPVPNAYIGYLLAQTANGARFDDREETTVDGHPATVVTATTERSIDGSLGCPGTGIVADDCFGIQPEYAMRLAVVTTDDGPLLIWVRSAAHQTADVDALPARLDQLLAGVRFSDR